AQLQAMIDQGVNAALAGTEGVVEITQWLERMEMIFRLSNCLAENQPEESDRVERYIGGLPDLIYGSVVASKPKTIQEATEMATGLMDKKIRTYAERHAVNKRKFEDISQNNQGRQQPPKRQDVARAYIAGSGNWQQSLTNANVANNQRVMGRVRKLLVMSAGYKDISKGIVQN
nr:hypothetical protein [Tanacetum cinerariifolium]